MSTARPRVVIAGLGPAGPELITAAVAREIERIPHRFVRTARHPSAAAVPGASSFDHLYESADTFDGVYAGIVEALVSAAREHGEILYAVPGSPHVLERTVRLLVADERVDCEVLASLSFLDLAYARLGIDPIETGIRLVDGHEFAAAAAGERGPLLVAHCHANWVLSEIKLAVEGATGEEEVVLLQRLGCPDESVVHTTWADLDRTVEADHLTTLYVPTLAAPVGTELVRFREIVRRLRSECPWDRAQTHASLAKYAVEETYELVEAIGALETGDDTDTADAALADELGDVLLQVFLHAAIAEQEGRFDLADVAANVSEKMIRRHPHVFADAVADDAEAVARNWAAIKAGEKEPAAGATAVFGGVSGALPALMHARELAAAAATWGFDWDDPRGTLEKVAEELTEVTEVFDDPDLVRGEIGDLLFAVVNVARSRGVDPESTMRQASAKFRRRVESVARLATDRGIDTTSCGLETLDRLWDEVKAAEGTHRS